MATFINTFFPTCTSSDLLVGQFLNSKIFSLVRGENEEFSCKKTEEKSVREITAAIIREIWVVNIGKTHYI